MQDAMVGSQDAPIAGYSLREAAALLGIGVNTLRRKIAASQIRAEQVHRPQGYVWRVYLDGRYPPDEAPNPEPTGSLPHPPIPPAPAEAIAAMIQATLTPVIGPLVAELAASRQANAALTDQLVSQGETIGDLRATVAVLRAEIATLTAPQQLVDASTAT